MSDLNKIQIEMLKQMLDWDDYSYGYYEFEDMEIDGTVVTKKALIQNMKALRELGLVKMWRGGLDGDGQIVGGTGFAIHWDKINEVKDIVK